MLTDLAAVVLTGIGIVFLLGMYLLLRVLEGIARASGEKARPWVYGFYALVAVWFIGPQFAENAYLEVGRNRCTVAIQSLEASYSAEGLLDNSTELTIPDIQALLSIHKLQYIETKIQTDIQGRIRVSRGDEPVSLPSIPSGEARYARFTLAPQGDPTCLTVPIVKDLTEYPYAGPLCVGISLSSETKAPLAYEYSKSVPNVQLYPEAILRDQSSGKVLASLPAMHQSLRSRLAHHRLGLQDANSNCFENPQATLLSRLHGHVGNNNYRFSPIEIELSPDYGTIRERESELPVVVARQANGSPKINADFVEARNGDWSKAVEQANGSGWSVYKNGRLDPHLRHYRHIAKTLGSDGHLWQVMWHQTGVLAWSAVRSWPSAGGTPLIANFDDKGQLQWAARVRISQPGITCDFVPSHAALVGSSVYLSAQCEGNEAPVNNFELVIDFEPLKGERSRMLLAP